MVYKGNRLQLSPLWFERFPGGSDGKASPCNAGDLGSIPGSGRSSGERNGNPLQYLCLENSMDGEAWWARVHGVAKSRTLLHLHSFFFVILAETASPLGLFLLKHFFFLNWNHRAIDNQVKLSGSYPHTASFPSKLEDSILSQKLDLVAMIMDL